MITSASTITSACMEVLYIWLVPLHQPFADQKSSPKSSHSPLRAPIMAKPEASIIKHLHLYNPPIPAPKISPFTKVFNAVKAWFMRPGREKMDRGDRMESRKLWSLKMSLIGLLTLKNVFLLVKLEMRVEIWMFNCCGTGIHTGAKGNCGQAPSSNGNQSLLCALCPSRFLEHATSF